MNQEKKNALIGEIIKLEEIYPFYVEYNEDPNLSVVSRRVNTCLHLTLGIKPPKHGAYNRRTCNHDGEVFSSMSGRSFVLVSTLTDKEKEMLCEIVCGFSRKVGIKNPKLLKKRTTEQVLKYSFR